MLNALTIVESVYNSVSLDVDDHKDFLIVNLHVGERDRFDFGALWKVVDL